MMSKYVTNGPVKHQEGICLVGPAHYRMMPPQRADGFHVPAPSFVQQQATNQPGNQGQTLRGITPAGPPNQASTPPTNDLKVQTVPQQQSMNHMFVPQPVRSAQGTYYRSAAGPPNQTPRMPNHNRGQQQIYPTQAPYMAAVPPMYISTASPMQYYNGQRPPQAFVQTPMPVFGGQHFSSLAYTPNPNQTPTVPFSFYSTLPRPGHPPQATTLPPNQTQSLHTMPIPPAAPQPNTFQRAPNKRRAKAIPIIDPNTGFDRLNEVFEQQNSSHPPSGESSARQTPQPSIPNPSKEVQATFAKQVAQVLSDEANLDDQEVHSSVDHIESNVYYPQPPASRLEHIALSSNLQVGAKEFQPDTAKDTPIVSANCDAAEFTLPNKVKDRESPAKGRKQREQQQLQTLREQQHSKDAVKEPTPPINNTSSGSNTNTIENTAPVVAPKSDNGVKHNARDAPASNVSSSNTNASSTSAPPLIKDSSKEAPHRGGDDRKNQKKDSKPEPKVLTSIDNENSSSATVSSSQQQPNQDSSNAKNRNASHKGKDAQKQQPPPHQAPPKVAQPQPAPVPQPQPAKPNNKSTKKTEINQKGANKEGTDMDAFNDNNIPVNTLDTVNANVNNNNDVINANSLTNSTTTITPTPPILNVPTSSVVNETNKKNNLNSGGNNGGDLTTSVRTEPVKTLPKGRIDVTDIVKEKPKPIKVMPAPAPSLSQDETDKAVTLFNDNVVHIKNDANKTISENNSIPTNELPYKEGQWSPNNPDGRKAYDKDFLLALRFIAASKKKPDKLPEVILADDRGRSSESGRYSMGGSRTDYTNPPFGSYGGKSSSQRGPPPKRNSQSGKIGNNSNKNSRPQVIKVSISVREDVKLNEVENAWKPARFLKGINMTEDELKTEELYKKVRGVLNKLTPQRFDTLLLQVRELDIDTAERLQGVIDLVFEKAVDEPNFSVAYALMCRELALMQVPTTNNGGDEKKDVVNFRKLLVTRCQVEFEKQSLDETVRNGKVKEIDECADPEKKKELEFDLEEYDRKLRMKSVGNIRFIGELFKQQMLTVNIMMRCLNNLLENKDEESLECLCKLLTTIGKELESKSINLNLIFNTMREIVDKKLAPSSRVRFMLQDVIDLRRSKWVPRRQDLDPKTIDQIQKEAENEQFNSQVMNSVPMTPRKDDRGSSSGSASDRKRSRNVSDDGWTTASRNSRSQFSVQSDKLKNKPPQTDEPLGCRQMFGNWSKGSNIKTEMSAATNTANMYAALEHIDTEKRPGSRPSSSKDPYSSKGPSLERSTYKQSYDGRGSSRSGSQHRSAANDQVATSTTSKTAPAVSVPPVPEPVEFAPKLTSEQLERRIINNLDEYLNDSCTVDDYAQDIQSSVPSSYLSRLVTDSYLHVLERSRTARLRTGMLFAKLINSEILPIDDYCAGLDEVLSQADDLTIDIPRIWEYLAEIIGHLVLEEALTFKRLHKVCALLISQNHGAKLLGELCRLIVNEQGPSFLSSHWQSSGLSLTEFMPQSQEDSFVATNKLEFLCGGDTSAGQTQLTYDQIYHKLVEFFKSKASFDDIVKWIIANVGERATDNKFVRTLATAVFENSIVRQKLVEENLKGHYKLLFKYIDNQTGYELQCLFALQALIHKMEHPQGLLLQICDWLYENNTISQDSFMSWETSSDPAEQEGKGVALKQLTSFFTQLRENEEEEEDYEGSTGSEET